MDGRSQQRLVVLALWSAAVLCGCTQGPFASTASWSPFAKKDDVYDPRQYGPTPREQLDEVRQIAAGADSMSAAEQEQTAEQFARRLQSETSPAMKLELLRALGRFNTPMAETALRVSLADADPQVRRTAVEAWSTRRSPQALQTLARVLASDTSLDVRLAAADGLANYEDRAAVDALAVALDDPDPALQYRAIQSLTRVTGRDYGVDVAAWRQYVQGQEPTPAPQPSFVQSWFDWF
ncbi:MAG: HEAT repeat domain-containing protein [Planctomycetes bacterium]|nr:HEAT repeat domain-containing protein [Planctomycetota bacterium]